MNACSKLIVSFLAILTLFLNSCTNDYTVYPEDEIDPLLLGDWYYTLPFTSESPGPKEAFYGLKFSNNKIMQQMGIETSTGRIKAYGEDIKIIYARDNLMIWEWVLPDYGTIVDTLRFDVSKQKLRIYDDHKEEVYYRTKFDTIVYPPVETFLAFKVDNKIYENAKIAPYPSACAYNLDNNSLLVIAETTSNYLLQIQVPDFKGTGSYNFYGHDAMIARLSGNLGFIMMTADSSSNNILIIEHWGWNNISGSFSFTSDSREKVDGIFSVILYK